MNRREALAGAVAIAIAPHVAATHPTSFGHAMATVAGSVHAVLGGYESAIKLRQARPEDLPDSPWYVKEDEAPKWLVLSVSAGGYVESVIVSEGGLQRMSLDALRGCARFTATMVLGKMKAAAR